MNRFAVLLTIGITVIAQLQALEARQATKLNASYANGWVGARAVGLGRMPDAIINDVYSIYWNPAGLADLPTTSFASKRGSDDRLAKESYATPPMNDLTSFSDGETRENTFEVGLSGAGLNLNGGAGFAGIAIRLFSGVMGIGGYGFEARRIGLYDDDERLLRKIDYTASAAQCSYGWKMGVTTMGVSLKYLREQAATDHYETGSADIGLQAEVFPLIRLAMVLKDLGPGFRHIEGLEELDDVRAFGAPGIRLSAAVTLPTIDASIVFGAGRPFAMPEYDIGAGIEYQICDAVAVAIGYSTHFVTGSLLFRIGGCSLSYAYAYDPVNHGHNHVVSASGGF